MYDAGKIVSQSVSQSVSHIRLPFFVVHIDNAVFL